MLQKRKSLLLFVTVFALLFFSTLPTTASIGMVPQLDKGTTSNQKRIEDVRTTQNQQRDIGEKQSVKTTSKDKDTSISKEETKDDTTTIQSTAQGNLSDLVITDIYIDKPKIVYQESPWTWVTFQVMNIGTVPVKGDILGDLVNVTRDGSAISRSGYFNVSYSGRLEPGNSTSHSFAVGHDSYWPVGDYKIQVRIDHNDDINELREDNNLSPFLEFSVVEDKPDLEIVDISIENDHIVQNATPWTWINFTVMNTGSVAINDTDILAQDVNVTLDGEPVTKSGYFNISYGDSLEPGETASHEFAVGHDASSWPKGHWRLQILVDHTGEVDEQLEDNNLSPFIDFYVAEDKPDLEIVDIYIDKTKIVYQESPWTWVHFVVENTGTAPLNGTDILAQDVNVTRDGQSVSTSGYFNVSYTSPLDPGETATHDFAVGHDSLWPTGHWKLQILVDYQDDIKEQGEDNNLSPFIEFDVVEDKPDLEIVSLYIDDPIIVHGSTPWTWVHFSVMNTGSVSINTSDILGQLVNVTLNGEPLSRSGYFNVSYNAPLDPLETASHKFAVGHDDYWSPGFYEIQIEIDHTNEVNEQIETNNLSPTLNFLVIANLPDLTITSISIEDDTIVYKETPWTWINVTFKNVGTKAISNTDILADLVNVYYNGDLITKSGYLNVTDNLAPGEYASHQFAVGHDDVWPPGDYSLQVRADYLDNIAELCEQNNLSPVISFTVIEEGPDLEITNISIEDDTIVYKETPWTWINVTVANTGTVDINNTDILADLVNVTKDGNSVSKSGYLNISTGLNAGESVSHQFAVGHDDVWPPGDYSLQVRVDYLDKINETSETNNLSPFISFTVIENNPDLYISTLELNTTQIEYNSSDTVWVEFGVGNNGSTAVERSYIIGTIVNMTRNGSPVADTGYFNISLADPLKPGEEVFHQFAVGHDEFWEPANYSLQIFIDSRNHVNETNEDNNISEELNFEVIPTQDSDDGDTGDDNDTGTNTTTTQEDTAATPDIALPGFQFVTALFLGALALVTYHRRKSLAN